MYLSFSFRLLACLAFKTSCPQTAMAPLSKDEQNDSGRMNSTSRTYPSPGLPEFRPARTTSPTLCHYRVIKDGDPPPAGSINAVLHFDRIRISVGSTVYASGGHDNRQRGESIFCMVPPHVSQGGLRSERHSSERILCANNLRVALPGSLPAFLGHS